MINIVFISIIVTSSRSSWPVDRFLGPEDLGRLFFPASIILKPKRLIILYFGLVIITLFLCYLLFLLVLLLILTHERNDTGGDLLLFTY